MKSFKLLLFSALMCFSYTINAQGDDWQTGGGASSNREIRDTARRYGDYTSGNSNYGQTLWNGGYESAPLGLVIGYVNKQWVSEYPSGVKQSENLFGEKNKRLHGMQIGFQATPTLPFGLGLRTGLFYEAYFSYSEYVKNKDWDKFTEHDLYIPAQALFRIPFTYNYDLTLFGGIGFQWAINGEYREWGHTINYPDGSSDYIGDREMQYYGGGWPKHVNWQAEAGFSLRFDMFQIGFTYSYGLTNHKLYNADFKEYATKSRQDKMTFSVGAVF